MELFHYLDVAIGFSMVMAVLSAVAGTAAEGWLLMIRTRVRHLQDGLGMLLDGLKVADPVQLAKDLLCDDRVRARFLPESLVRMGKGMAMGAAEALTREDLVMNLLRKGLTNADLRSKLAQQFQIGDLEKTIAQIQAKMLEEETANPQAPSHLWRTKAVAAVVPGLAARIFGEFDSMMDRVTDNVGFTGRIVSSVCAGVFLFGFYPVDSFSLLARLSNEEGVRKTLVEQAQVYASPQASEAFEKMQVAGLFGPMEERRGKLDQPGVWVTWVLVSLGAPFWLGLLNKILGLRSEMARKEEEQRSFRQQQQPS